jgi:hypothetical protein
MEILQFRFNGRVDAMLSRLPRTIQEVRAWFSSIAAWPLAARIMSGVLIVALVLVGVLWIEGRHPWGGPLDVGSVGSLGEWVSSIGALVAVLVTVRQFTLSKEAERDHEERAEAMKITAWATWTEIGDAGSALSATPNAPVAVPNKAARRVTVANGAYGALFDWNVSVVPGDRWTDYVHMSARMGQLPPGSQFTIAVDKPPPGVTVKRYRQDPRDRGIPRFIVVAFTDAWGGGWIRVNGDLRRVPRESHFIPRLVHLRNPAMPWAGILDEADWYAFREAVGFTDLPERLEDLIPSGEGGFPWLGERVREEVAGKVLACTLRERGHTEYEYHERAVVRTVNRTTAFQKTQTFFKIANQSKRGEILYITRS